ncbi:MAG: ImmA/IrrE family metallo-endopeptidase [Pseudonocardiaceae bacterium]
MEGFPGGLDGLAWCRDGFRLILVSNTVSWTRQRFTLAHELGHAGRRCAGSPGRSRRDGCLHASGPHRDAGERVRLGVPDARPDDHGALA